MATVSKNKISKTKQVTVKMEMPFTKVNYILMVVGITIILGAFFLMYIDHQVDGFISLTLAPYLIILGYAELIFAIMYRKNEKVEENIQ